MIAITLPDWINPSVTTELSVIVFLAAATGCACWLLALYRQLVLFRLRFEAYLQDQLPRLHVFVDPGYCWCLLMFIASGGFVLFVVAFESTPLAVFWALLVGAVPRIALNVIEVRRIRRFSEQMPDLLEHIATLLRSGTTLPAAIERISKSLRGPAAQELRQVQRELRLGVSLCDSLSSMADRAPAAGLRTFVCSVSVALDSGGQLAGATHALAVRVRRELLQIERRRALTSQARLQAQVMTGIPFLVAAALAFIDPEPLQALPRYPMGQALLGLSFVMCLVGYRLVRRIAVGRPT